MSVSFQPKQARIDPNSFQQQPLSLVQLDNKCIRAILEFLNLQDLARICHVHRKIHGSVSSMLSDNLSSLPEIVKKVFSQVIGSSDSTSQKLQIILLQTHQEMAQFGVENTPENPMDLAAENINAFFDTRVQLAMKEVRFAKLLSRQFWALGRVCNETLDENLDSIQKVPILRTVITNWQSNSREVRKIKALNLPDARISSLPMYIGGFRYLTSVDLSDNSLSFLPSSFSTLTALQTLNLNNNCFQTFPVCICQLSLLENLYLNGNELESVPDDVQNLSKLRSLQLSDNRLTTLSAKIFEIFTLQTLHIRGNLSLDSHLKQLIRTSIKKQPRLQSKLSSLFSFSRLYTCDLVLAPKLL